MRTEQINLRLRHELIAALERVAEAQSLDRGDVIRRLLERGIREWDLDHALDRYQRGEISIGLAAEESGHTHWEILELARSRGVAHGLTAEDVERQLEVLVQVPGRKASTLPDIEPAPGGVLLVGINPAPVSVAAGHYYQGRLGKRLWRRLERVGLLMSPTTGAEDDAFAAAGHGLTDLVKRPAASASELGEAELREGAAELREKIRAWRPGLVLFAFREPARRLLGNAVRPGPGSVVEDVPTFLLSGPYAPVREAEEIDAELRSLVGSRAGDGSGVATQPIQPSDVKSGRIRLKQGVRYPLPPDAGDVDVVLRGARLRARWNPRSGSGRSPTLQIAREHVSELEVGKALRVSRGLGGVIRLD